MKTLPDMDLAYYQGLEAKAAEIREMGYAAAREKFNADHPFAPGAAYSRDAWLYANGELDALLAAADARRVGAA